MKKITLFVFILLFMGFMCSGSFAQVEKPTKKGYEDYIAFLKDNKEALNYNTYGLIEHSDEVVIKVYCSKETKDMLLESLKDFNYKTYQFEEFSESQIVISIFFELTKPPEKVELEEKEAVEKKDEETIAEEIKPEEIVKEKVEEKEKQALEKKKCPGRVKVQVRRIGPKIFKEHKYFEESILYDQDSVIKTQLTASVKEILVAEGDRLKQGQVVVRLDSTVLEKEIKSVEALVKKWQEILYKRQHWKERSPRAEKQAEDQLMEAEELLAQKEDDLANTQIQAPFDGKVMYIVSEGEPLEAGAIAFRIATDHLMKVSIPESDAELFKHDMEIKVFCQEVEAEILASVSKTEEKTKILLNNEDFKLSEGMKVNFRVLFKLHEEVIVLSENEILKDQDGSFVYVVDGKFASKRKLELGPVEEGKVLVLSGLNIDDEVIITGIECLKDRKKIKVMVWDEKKGKLRARKKKEEIEIEKIVPEEIEIERVPVEKVIKKKNFWRVGAGAGYYMVTDDLFTEIYGSSTLSGFVTASFTIKEKVEIFFSVAYVTKNGEFTISEEDTKLIMIPFYIGIKYIIKKTKKFEPFVGAALVRYNLKEVLPASTEYHPETETNYHSNFGAAILAGTYWSIGSKLDFIFSLKYDISQSPIEELDEKINLSGLRAFIGLTYSFGRK